MDGRHITDEEIARFERELYDFADQTDRETVGRILCRMRAAEAMVVAANELACAQARWSRVCEQITNIFEPFTKEHYKLPAGG